MYLRFSFRLHLATCSGLPLFCFWIRVACFCFLTWVFFWLAFGLPFLHPFVCSWFALGLPLVCLRSAFGLPVVRLWLACPWVAFGLLLVQLWFDFALLLVSFGLLRFASVCLWFTLGLRLACSLLPSVCHWIALSLHLVCFSFTFGLLFVYRMLSLGVCFWPAFRHMLLITSKASAASPASRVLEEHKVDGTRKHQHPQRP